MCEPFLAQAMKAGSSRWCLETPHWRRECQSCPNLPSRGRQYPPRLGEPRWQGLQIYCHNDDPDHHHCHHDFITCVRRRRCAGSSKEGHCLRIRQEENHQHQKRLTLITRSPHKRHVFGSLPKGVVGSVNINHKPILTMIGIWIPSKYQCWSYSNC